MFYILFRPGPFGSDDVAYEAPDAALLPPSLRRITVLSGRGELHIRGEPVEYKRVKLASESLLSISPELSTPVFVLLFPLEILGIGS